MDRVAKIDMQVQTDIGDLGEDVEALLADDSFQEEVDDDDDAASDSDSDDSEDELDDDERRLKYLRLSIYKLDAMLDLLFGYCSPAFQDKQSADEKTIFGRESVVVSASGSPWHHPAWTKNITSSKYAGHPTQHVFSRRFNTVGSMEEV